MGDTFIATFGNEQPHLWVVICVDGLHAICVNLSTCREHSDTSTILHRGEHPFIKHDSAVVFKKMTTLNAEKILQAASQGVVAFQTKASPQVLDKIRAGASVSRHTPIRYRSMFERAATRVGEMEEATGSSR